MSELHNLDDAALASRRDGFGPVQRLWSLPEASRHPSAHISQNRCHQVAQSCKDRWSRAEEKGERPQVPSDDRALTPGPTVTL